METSSSAPDTAPAEGAPAPSGPPRPVPQPPAAANGARPPAARVGADAPDAPGGQGGPANPAAGDGAVWRVPWAWRFGQWLSLFVVPLFCRLRVTGDVSAELKAGPLILAGNHISNFDPVAVTLATRRRHIAARMMATGGLFRAPVVGTFMAKSGHIPVDRGKESIANAVPAAVQALRQRSIVFIYPEGRIGLDPGLWPERAKTGLARLAIGTGAPVVPVATWGSHEVIAYHGRGPMIRTLLRSIWRRPVVRIHFGAPVDLSDLREGVIGHAQQASSRVMDALTAELAVLRQDEPRLPRFRDPTRPISSARTHRSRRRG